MSINKFETIHGKTSEYSFKYCSIEEIRELKDVGGICMLIPGLTDIRDPQQTHDLSSLEKAIKLDSQKYIWGDSTDMFLILTEEDSDKRTNIFEDIIKEELY